MFVLPLRYILPTIPCTTRKKSNRNVLCTTTIRFFSCPTQNLIVYCCLCRHSLPAIAKYTGEVARTHYILTAVAQGHVNLIRHNLRKRRTIHYCFDSCCAHTISGLLLHAAQYVSVFIGLPSYFKNENYFFLIGIEKININPNFLNMLICFREIYE